MASVSNNYSTYLRTRGFDLIDRKTATRITQSIEDRWLKLPKERFTQAILQWIHYTQFGMTQNTFQQFVDPWKPGFEQQCNYTRKLTILCQLRTHLIVFKFNQLFIVQTFHCAFIPTIHVKHPSARTASIQTGFVSGLSCARTRTRKYPRARACTLHNWLGVIARAGPLRSTVPYSRRCAVRVPESVGVFVSCYFICCTVANAGEF